MSGAFFVSWAGTAGTLIGAAVGSVIATVGAATYTWSLRRTSEAARRTAALVKRARPGHRDPPAQRLAQGPLREDGNDRSDAPDEPGMPPSPVEEPAEIATGKGRWDLPWVQGRPRQPGGDGRRDGRRSPSIEAVTGKPLSVLLRQGRRHQHHGRHVFGGDSKPSTDDDQTPTKNDAAAAAAGALLEPVASSPSRSSNSPRRPRRPRPARAPRRRRASRRTPATTRAPGSNHRGPSACQPTGPRISWTSGNGFRRRPVARPSAR